MASGSKKPSTNNLYPSVINIQLKGEPSKSSTIARRPLEAKLVKKNFFKILIFWFLPNFQNALKVHMLHQKAQDFNITKVKGS